ncbi:unnamed protein product [Sphacelaria rigidula]
MNMYFQYSDDVGIGMGGGGGSFGLFLGEDLLTGTTGKCDTFDNPPLCSKEAFDVSQVEVRFYFCSCFFVCLPCFLYSLDTFHVLTTFYRNRTLLFVSSQECLFWPFGRCFRV